MGRWITAVSLAALAVAGWWSPGRAQVSVGIYLPAPPSLVIIPGTPIAYAPAAPANYFFYGGQYYLFAADVWYAGPTYNGPWAVVVPALVPAPLLTVPVKYYRKPPAHWKGWRPDAPPPWSGVDAKKAAKEREKPGKRK